MSLALIFLLSVISTSTAGVRPLKTVPTAAVLLEEAELNEILAMVRGNSSHTRVERSAEFGNLACSRAVVRKAVGNLFPRVRRSLSPNDTVSELAPWADDLAILKQIFEDMRENPRLSPGDLADVNAVLNTIEGKMEEMGNLMQKYKTALYSSVVHPADEINLETLVKVIEMINEVNEQNFTVPMFNKAAHSISGIYIASVQNLLIMGGLNEERKSLRNQLEGTECVGKKRPEELERLRSQVEQAKSLLTSSLSRVGLKTSTEVESLTEIVELAKGVKEVVMQSERLAMHAIRLSEKMGSTANADYQALRKYADRVNGREEESGEDWGEVEQQDGTSDERGCRKDIKVEKNAEGHVIRLGGEWAHKTFGMFPRSQKWVYDYRGECVLPAPEEDSDDSSREGSHSRPRREVRNWGQLTLLEVMELSGKVMAQASSWTDRVRGSCSTCLRNARNCETPSWCTAVQPGQ